MPPGIFIKLRKAAKNASAAPKAAPAAQETPAVHAAAVNTKKVKKAVLPLFHRVFTENGKHRGIEPPRCFSFFIIML